MINRVLKQVMQNISCESQSVKVELDEFGIIEIDERKVLNVGDLNILPYPGNEVDVIDYLTKTIRKRLMSKEVA